MSVSKSEIREFVFFPNTPTGREISNLLKEYALLDYDLDSYVKEVSTNMISTGFPQYKHILRFRRRVQ